MLHHLYLISAMVIVGSSVPVGRIVALDMPVYLTLCARFAVGSAALYAFMRVRGVKLPALKGRVLFMSAALALLGSVLFNVFIIAGLREVTAVSSGILTGTLPVVLLMLSLALLGERVTAQKLSAVAVSAAGVMLVNVSNASGGTGGTLKGSIFVLLAVLCEALFLLLRKFLPKDFSSLALSFYVSLFGLIYFMPAGIYEAFHGKFAEITVSGFVLIAYYGLFITAAAYILWFEGIGHVAGAYASVYTSFMPVSAVVLSSLFLHERITAAHAGGLALIVFAVLMLAFQNIKR